MIKEERAFGSEKKRSLKQSSKEQRSSNTRTVSQKASKIFLKNTGTQMKRKRSNLENSSQNSIRAAGATVDSRSLPVPTRKCSPVLFDNQEQRHCFKSSYSENMMTSCAIMMNGRFSAPACCLWMRILFTILISMMMAKSWNHKYHDLFLRWKNGGGGHDQTLTEQCKCLEISCKESTDI